MEEWMIYKLDKKPNQCEQRQFNGEKTVSVNESYEKKNKKIILAVIPVYVYMFLNK